MRLHVRRDSSLLFERLDDGSSVIFDPNADRAHALNPAATRVWEVLDAGGGPDEVGAALAEVLGREVDEAAVLNTLHQLQEAGLVEVDTPEALVAYSSRREVIRRLSLGFAAAMAYPFVETLTGAEQRVYAQGAGSMTTTAVFSTTVMFTTTSFPTTPMFTTTTPAVTTTTPAPTSTPP